MINTMIPAIISITPTIIIKVYGEKGMYFTKGVRYLSQSTSTSKNLSMPVIIGRMPKVHRKIFFTIFTFAGLRMICLLYTSDAADDLLCVDLGGRRIIKK